MAHLKLGDRVQLHPATDQWMQGDRYGEVVGFSRLHNVRVRLERSGRIAHMHPDNVTPVRDVQLRRAVERGLRACSACCLDNEEEIERVLSAVMTELSLCGIRETTIRPPASADHSSESDTERPPCR